MKTINFSRVDKAKFFRTLNKRVNTYFKENKIKRTGNWKLYTKAILMFSLLGIFLLTHKQSYKHEMMRFALQGIEDLHSLNLHVRSSMAISVFGASALILSMWHIDASLVKQLSHLDKVSQSNIKGNEQDEIVLFMLSCLYFAATGHNNFDDLEQKSTILGIQNFDEIKQLLLTLS